MIFYILLTLFALTIALKSWYISKLKRKRNKINFTTKKGQYEISRINKIINGLNGVYLWKSLTKR